MRTPDRAVDATARAASMRAKLAEAFGPAARWSVVGGGCAVSVRAARNGPCAVTNAGSLSRACGRPGDFVLATAHFAFDDGARVTGMTLTERSVCAGCLYLTLGGRLERLMDYGTHAAREGDPWFPIAARETAELCRAALPRAVAVLERDDPALLAKLQARPAVDGDAESPCGN